MHLLELQSYQLHSRCAQAGTPGLVGARRPCTFRARYWGPSWLPVSLRPPGPEVGVGAVLPQLPSTFLGPFHHVILRATAASGGSLC